MGQGGATVCWEEGVEGIAEAIAVCLRNQAVSLMNEQYWYNSLRGCWSQVQSVMGALRGGTML